MRPSLPNFAAAQQAQRRADGDAFGHSLCASADYDHFIFQKIFYIFQHFGFPSSEFGTLFPDIRQL